MGRQNLRRRKSGPSTAEEDLHAAARSGDLMAVQTIVVSNPLTVNSRDKHSRTPLHLAAWSGHLQVVSYLCQQKADVGAAAMDDMGAIHFAAQKGRLEIVKALVSSGVSVKSLTRKGFTLLHYAAQGAYLELAKYLVKKGASLSTKNKAGKTPVDLASNDEVRSFLVECEKSPELVEELKGKKGDKKPKSDHGVNAGRSSEEGERGDKEERVKRKVDEEETEEASLPKKAKVSLNHLMSSDDTPDDEE